MPPSRRPVRVLVVHPRDPAAPTNGGIQTFLHDFIKYSPPDFEITIAGVTRDRSRRPIGRRATITIGDRRATLLAMAPADRLPRDPVAWLAMGLAQLRLRAAMVRGRAILQIHRPYRPVYLIGHRGPRVQFIHVDLRDWPGPSAWNRLPKLYRQFSDKALGAMARIFVVNEPGAQKLRADHPMLADRIEFLPVWYDPNTFAPVASRERDQARSDLLVELGLGEDSAGDRLILFAGRLDPIKDPHLAIDAVATLARDAAMPVRLVMAGAGTQRAALEMRAHQLGIDPRTHLLGDIPRARLAGIMRAADVLLLTSHAEGGGPRVVLEALASGLPVVAPPVGEVRRTVTHMVNGWLFEERTPDAVAHGLRWVLDQPAGQLAGAASAAAEPYTADRVLERVYRAYRELSTTAAARTGSGGQPGG